MLTVGSLFSGIGGFDLGLERAGMRTVWFCEQDPFCQRVLARHWPGVPVYDDVCALVGHAYGAPEDTHAEEGPPRQATGEHGGERRVPVPVPSVDVLCGGFPCQDLSYAGAGAGIEGERSGLWSEYARLVGELRPRYVVVENVAALLARGLGRVLGDLAALGYDAEWDCIPASAIGAPHRRDRIWLVAYPAGGEGVLGRDEQERGRSVQAEQAGLGGTDLADASLTGLEGSGLPRRSALGGADVADPADLGHERSRPAWDWWSGSADSGRGGPAEWWRVEPDVGRVAHGVPARVDRLRALGNALVPQIAEWIGTRIIEWEGRVAA